ncbi:hypothetical protein BsWGS_10217 [Bradybaena similaris]
MSVVAEILDVNNAVGRLQELGDRMRSGEFFFEDTDVINLEQVISAINELEDERILMHERLETETIKCSILRHDLKMLPQKIKDETMMAVNAARQLNTETLKNLQSQLDDINNSLLDLETRSDYLEKENIVLRPESELLRQQHEEIIEQLNQKMAEKAMMQITLNETRDHVKQINQNIVDLEDGMVQLKEDLIQERNEAKFEKKQLRKVLIDTQIKTRHQKEQNVEKKKELDTLMEKLMDSEGRLDLIKKSLRHYETSKSKLETEEKVLTSQLEHQLKENEIVKRKRAEIMNEIIKEQQEFERKQNQLLKKIKTFEDDITKESVKNVMLNDHKAKLHIDLKGKEKVKEADSVFVQELDEVLQSVKQKYATKAEEMGQLYNENMKLTQESNVLAESHKAVVTQLNRQINELAEQLATETNHRIELQKKKDESEQALIEVKSALQQYMANVTESIQEGKKRHSQLSSEGLQLQKEVIQAETEVQTLQNKLNVAVKEFESMSNTMQSKVDKLKEEIVSIEKEIQEKQNVISEMTPDYEDLKQFFSLRSEEFDSVKKSIVALKNKKTSLEDAIKRAKKERDDLKLPQEIIRGDLKNYRAQVMAQIKDHGSDTKEIEEQIFLVGAQLRIILEENNKLEEACKKLEDDLADLEIQAQENEKMKKMVQDHLMRERNDFVNKWKADNSMQEVLSSQDQVVADAFGHLLTKAEKRENKIDEVTFKLHEELQVLSDFLSEIVSKPSNVPNKLESKQGQQQQWIHRGSLLYKKTNLCLLLEVGCHRCFQNSHPSLGVSLKHFDVGKQTFGVSFILLYSASLA